MTTEQPEAPTADHPEQPLEMGARWYMVNKDGMATLCTDREDAEKEAKDANMAWPHTAPHRAVQLVEVASVAASAGSEPVAWRVQFDEWWAHNRVSTHQVKNVGGFAAKVWHAAIQAAHPSPPEGMVAEQALRKVLSVVQRYLPPDGPTAYDAMTEITAIVDPWPLDLLEKS